MSGHRRKPQRIAAVDRFAADAEAIHKTLIGYSSGLRPSSPQYRAIDAVHDALLRAVAAVTGAEAPWIGRSNVGPARLPESDAK